MIFVTVGTQLGFDRLISTVDTWAKNRGSTEVFAQIGNGKYIPTSIKWERYLPPSKFNELFANATVIVSHAGMGSIIAALTHEKPLIALPRRFENNEHRNNHQLATADRLRELAGIYFAREEESLIELLDRSSLLKPGKAGEHAPSPLLESISNFINSK